MPRRLPAPIINSKHGRLNNDKGYGPGNCRWATPTEQARNRRRIPNLRPSLSF